MKHSDPAVVAKARPESERLGEGGGREGGKGRELFDPAVVIGNDGCDLGLLQHDLGDPYPVGIVRMPPGEVAFVSGVPAEDLSGKL